MVLPVTALLVMKENSLKDEAKNKCTTLKVRTTLHNHMLNKFVSRSGQLKAGVIATWKRMKPEVVNMPLMSKLVCCSVNV